MFESRISVGAKEIQPTRASGKPDAETISSWSYDMEGHAKKCVERYCEHANQTTQQIFKVATPRMDDHQFKEEVNESAGELSTVCSQHLLECLYLARIGRLDIWWSVNKLARAVIKWTKSCDKRLARLISYIHHTSEYRHFCYVRIAAQQCRVGLFQDSDFARDLEDSKSTSGEVLCICLEVTRLCQLVGCARSRLQFHTVLQKLKSFRSMQVCAWTVFPLSFFGIW